MIATQTASGAIRLDKWLWFARLCKNRALAQKLIERGQIMLNGTAVRKASTSVRIGDGLTAVLGPVKRFVVIKALGERRGPAPEAQGLYEDTQPPQRLDRDDQGLRPHRPLLTRAKGAGRPTKKERRAIDKFYDR